jgi:arylsulfatase
MPYFLANTYDDCRRPSPRDLLIRTTPRLLLALATIVSPAVFSQSVIAAPSVRPNIVLIMSDDMGYSDIGCYGGEIDTPNLNRLAEQGVRFTQFYNCGRCCPTRASLITGLYPHQAGIGWMTTDRGHDGYRGDLNRQCVTIAEVLGPAGYATYMCGKWHMTKATRPEGPNDNWPLQRGFHRFYGTITGAGSFFDPGTLARGNQMISPFNDPEYQPSTYYYTDAISDHAVRFINEHQQREKKPNRPFFLYVAYTAAHWPMHALPEDIAKYHGKYDRGYEATRQARYQRMLEIGLIDKSAKMTPPVGDWATLEHRAWEQRCMEVYAAMIDSMDQGIGRIVQALETNGQLDNTLILFLQDNGGCQETVGRQGKLKRPVEPSLPVIREDAIRTDVIPRQNRRGIATLKGPGVMPGPEDTYIAYGIEWAHVSNTPFREYKHFVHEGGISSPLIAHWPLQIKHAGALVRRPSHLIDIMATCVEVAGAEYPKQRDDGKIHAMEGTSLSAAWSAPEDGRKSPLFWEHEANRAVRLGDWKLVAKENRPWELYDLARDRSELNDLADANPSRVTELSDLWERYAERANVLPLGTWRAAPRQVKFSNKKRFQLAQNADLKQGRSPMIRNTPFVITAIIAAKAPSGVIVAQGGTNHGYSLYLNDGQLIFAVRRGGKLSQVAAKMPALPQGDVEIQLDWKANAEVEFRVGGQQIGGGRLPGLLTGMPIDGLQVGTDLNGHVADYPQPLEFQGRISSVTIRLK